MATDVVNFDHHLAAETGRLIAAVADAVEQDEAALQLTVPSCPDWSLADLVWHISEVQDFWAHILTSGVDSPADYQRPVRPDDDQLVELLTSRLTLLQAGLNKPDDDPCWSWSPTGGTVAWVRRRQAQEALVHRVDAELAVGDRTAINESLAVDGVDEMLTVMLGAHDLPDWGDFAADRGQLALVTGERRWTVETGRLSGTMPDGEDMDLAAVRLVEPDAATDDLTTISGSGADINLWLWGRVDLPVLSIDGDKSRADKLRMIAAEVTGQ